MIRQILITLLLPATLCLTGYGAQARGNNLQSSVASAPGKFSFPANEYAVHVPFEILANGVFVSAQVNGKGPFLFEIDTGSSASVFASELTQELGLKPHGEMSGMGAGSTYNMGMIHGRIEFTLPGGLKLTTDDASTVPMAGLWPLLGRRMYGDIGYDALKGLVVRFDYENGVVTFFLPAAYEYQRKGERLDAHLFMQYDPQIAGAFTVHGQAPVPARFTIDTGAGGTIITTPLVKANHLREVVSETIPSPSHGVGGGESNDVVGRIDSILLGTYELKRPLVALSQDTAGSLTAENLGVNLGGNILRRFTVTIDYPHQTVTLEPNSHFGDPFLADASGLVLKAAGNDFKTFVVQGVVMGSPAARVGLQENDVITAVAGTPAGKYALWQVQDLLKNSGHLLELTIKRGSRSFTCELVLRSLI